MRISLFEALLYGLISFTVASIAWAFARNGVTFKRHNRIKTIDGSWGRCIHCEEPTNVPATIAVDPENVGAIEMSNEGAPSGE